MRGRIAARASEDFPRTAFADEQQELFTVLSARLQKLDRAFGQTRSAEQDAFVFDVEGFQSAKGRAFLTYRPHGTGLQQATIIEPVAQMLSKTASNSSVAVNEL